MIGIVLRVLAFLAFVLAAANQTIFAANQTIFSQPPADLVAWGLAFWVLATLVGDAVWPRRPAA